MVIRGANSDTIPMNNSEWIETTVVDIITETPTVKSFVFKFPHVVTHMAGQHYEIRLTAENGYQAARLYSAGSNSNNDTFLKLTIAYMKDGEVSPYMHDFVQMGDTIEVRGPLGRFFVWNDEMIDPVLLIGGGSGIVPMRVMLDEHSRTKSAAEMKLLYGTRSYEDIIYKNRLLGDNDAVITLSRNTLDTWKGESGRIDEALLEKVLHEFSSIPLCYVCGATAFVETIATLLQNLGVDAGRIKAERFGA